jgi:hypothetical protein
MVKLLRIPSLILFLGLASSGCETGHGTGQLGSAGEQTLPTVISGDLFPEFRFVTRLGAFDGPGILEETPLDIVLDSAGRIIVTVATSTTPAVFDTTGTYLVRLGRVGEGPGEFQWPTEIEVGQDGSVHVLDPGLARVNVFDSSLEFSESYAWRTRSGYWLRLKDGRFVVNPPNPTRDPKETLSIVDRGLTLQRFGQLEEAGARRLASSRDGGFWAAHHRRYQLDRWSENGSLLDSILPVDDWFARSEGINLGNPSRPPAPRIRDVREDSDGRLWVLLWRPREDWQEAWRNSRISEGQTEARASQIPSYGELYVSQIDVYDPAEGELVSSLRWEETVYRFAGDGLLANLHQDDLGAEYIDLWRVSLRTGGGL